MNGLNWTHPGATYQNWYTRHVQIELKHPKRLILFTFVASDIQLTALAAVPLTLYSLTVTVRLLDSLTTHSDSREGK